ncbi:MAG: hypothetical protein IPM98_05045 [Lewinellaceae bacterium]|nr:hypothetical protein [Lewinellaceae bacterium]
MQRQPSGEPAGWNGRRAVAGDNLSRSVPSLQGGANCRVALGSYAGLAVVSGNCGGPLNPIVQSPPPGTLVNPGTVGRCT